MRRTGAGQATKASRGGGEGAVREEVAVVVAQGQLDLHAGDAHQGVWLRVRPARGLVRARVVALEVVVQRVGIVPRLRARALGGATVPAMGC